MLSHPNFFSDLFFFVPLNLLSPLVFVFVHLTLPHLFFFFYSSSFPSSSSPIRFFCALLALLPHSSPTNLPPFLPLSLFFDSKGWPIFTSYCSVSVALLYICTSHSFPVRSSIHVEIGSFLITRPFMRTLVYSFIQVMAAGFLLVLPLSRSFHIVSRICCTQVLESEPFVCLPFNFLCSCVVFVIFFSFSLFFIDHDRCR